MGRTTKFLQIFVLLVAAYLPVFGAYPDTVSYVNNSVNISALRQCVCTNLLNSTKRWKGIQEMTGNNDHPMITTAMKLCGLSGNRGYPWCAACMAEIHDYANIPAPHSARVVDWFKQNVIWKREWGDKYFSVQPGMVGALYYKRLGRYGHIVLIIGEDNNNYYTLEGNTNSIGSREGQGFYKKIRSKQSIAAIADYCLNGNKFIKQYNKLLQKSSR